jgi:hypothetical protein
MYSTKTHGTGYQAHYSATCTIACVLPGTPECSTKTHGTVPQCTKRIGATPTKYTSLSLLYIYYNILLLFFKSLLLDYMKVMPAQILFISSILVVQLFSAHIYNILGFVVADNGDSSAFWFRLTGPTDVVSGYKFIFVLWVLHQCFDHAMAHTSLF